MLLLGKAISRCCQKPCGGTRHGSDNSGLIPVEGHIVETEMREMIISRSVLNFQDM